MAEPAPRLATLPSLRPAVENEQGLRDAIVELYLAYNPDHLDRLHQVWIKYPGVDNLRRLWTGLRAKYEPGVQQEPFRDKDLTVRDALISLLEVHAVAHTDRNDLPCLADGWSPGVQGLLGPTGHPTTPHGHPMEADILQNLDFS